jgi:GNAT superfamily N-acetyltransferase
MAQSDMTRQPQLRPFRQADAPALAEFLTRLHPEEPRETGSMQASDERRGGEHHARTLAWQDERLVGVVETESARMFTQPGWYGLYVHTADFQLWDTLEAAGLETLRPLSPRVLHHSVREGWPEYGVLTGRGWREHERMWLSHLDLGEFEPEAFAARLERSRTAGIEVRSLSELGWDAAGPAANEALARRQYELTVALLADVPAAEAVVPWPFELWRERVHGHPDFTPEGPLIAVAQGEWAGLTELYLPRREMPGMLHQGLTGVRKDWRDRGVAWALKLAAAERARNQGWTSVQTGNHTVNREMLSINAAMGFVRGPARVVLIREWER